MSTIYDQKKDEDGFLYVTYSGENTFGQIKIDFLSPVSYHEFSGIVPNGGCTCSVCLHSSTLYIT